MQMTGFPAFDLANYSLGKNQSVQMGVQITVHALPTKYPASGMADISAKCIAFPMSEHLTMHFGWHNQPPRLSCEMLGAKYAANGPASDPTIEATWLTCTDPCEQPCDRPSKQPCTPGRVVCLLRHTKSQGTTHIANDTANLIPAARAARCPALCYAIHGAWHATPDAAWIAMCDTPCKRPIA
eukprot:gene7895-biopygen46